MKTLYSVRFNGKNADGEYLKKKKEVLMDVRNEDWNDEIIPMLTKYFTDNCMDIDMINAPYDGKISKIPEGAIIVSDDGVAVGMYWIEEVEDIPMNNEKRSRLRKAISLLDEAAEIVGEVSCDERETYNNLPIQLQDSDRGEQFENNADDLEDLLESFTELENSIEEIISRRS